MGNYISRADLEKRLTAGTLENLAGVSGEALTQLADGIISRAEAFVDAYASIRFRTPLPPGGLVSEWSLRIAEYELWKRGPGADVPEKIKDSYRECVSLLNDLAQGRIEPSSKPEAARGEGTSIAVRTDAEPLFDSGSMASF